MYVTDKAEIVIDASSEDIWEYVTDPVHWTASNPEEHYLFTRRESRRLRRA